MTKDAPQVPPAVPRRSECPVCGATELATGRTELREGKTYEEFACTECHSTGWEWHADRPDRRAVDPGAGSC